MGWKQCLAPAGPATTDIQMSVVGFAHRSDPPRTFALFSRPAEDGRGEVLLLTPDAVGIMGGSLPPTWVNSSNPQNFTWTLLYGPRDSLERFGLQPDSFSPATVMID